VNPDTLVLLLVALLLLVSAPGGVDAAEVTFDGAHDAATVDGALVVAGGTVSVDSGTTTAGPVYLVGGDFVVNGTVSGDVVQFAGNLTLADSAVVSGRLRHVGGRESVAPGSQVTARSDVVSSVSGRQSPVGDAAAFLGQTLLLAASAYVLARRRPALLSNVADSIANHSLVSVVVGTLASLTALSLFVFMAFTLVLLPVSLLGLLVGGGVVLYGVVALGYLAGSALDWDSERRGLTAALGVVGVQVALGLLNEVPFVGGLAALLVLATAVGAVLVTYFGLREFEPVELPE
jgi:hypothetical protein